MKRVLMDLNDCSLILLLIYCYLFCYVVKELMRYNASISFIDEGPNFPKQETHNNNMTKDIMKSLLNDILK